jgi:hypothetical protein
MGGYHLYYIVLPTPTRSSSVAILFQIADRLAALLVVADGVSVVTELRHGRRQGAGGRRGDGGIVPTGMALASIAVTAHPDVHKRIIRAWSSGAVDCPYPFTGLQFISEQLTKQSPELAE